MTLLELVTEIGRLLKQNHLSLATAESCTGGGLSYWLTSVSGSSEWFDRGFVTYSDTAKLDMLGVSMQTLTAFGAVSEETARAMAEGALKMSTATVSIAITGIAGPLGGNEAKPVGTVFIAWAMGEEVLVKPYLFSGDREAIRTQSILAAFNLLLERLKK